MQDDSGSVSQSEFIECMRTVGVKLSDEEFEILIECFDQVR